MNLKPMQFARGFSRTPLRGGILMLAVSVCLILAFGGTFAIALFGPKSVRGVMPPGLIVLSFGILSLVAWVKIAAILPARFNVREILVVCSIGVSPVLLGTLHQYYVLAVIGPEGCVGGSIAVLFIGTFAVIGAVVSMLVGSFLRR